MKCSPSLIIETPCHWGQKLCNTLFLEFKCQDTLHILLLTSTIICCFFRLVFILVCMYNCIYRVRVSLLSMHYIFHLVLPRRHGHVTTFTSTGNPMQIWIQFYLLLLREKVLNIVASCPMCCVSYGSFVGEQNKCNTINFNI